MSIKLNREVVEKERAELSEKEQEQLSEDIKKENESFENAFDKALEEDKPKVKKNAYKVDGLATRIKGIFDQRCRERNLWEQKWLSNLRQFKGEYDEDVLNNLHPNRSKAFMRSTRAKVKTMTSRLTDLLFPSTGDKNWDIAPTPIPETDPEQVQLMVMQYQEATGEMISPEDLNAAIRKQSEMASENMSKEIADQLTDLRYRDIIKSVIHSGCLYGTGVLKGPLIKLKKNKQYVQDANGNWVMLSNESLTPFIEYVPLWDFYPDMSAKTIMNCHDIIQRHNMDKHRVIQLADRGDFDRDAINQYLVNSQTGNYEKKSHEIDLDAMGDVQTVSGEHGKDRKYEVLEFWGYVDSYDLQQLGVDVPKEMEGLQELKANIWVLGDRVIKAAINPLEGMVWPYFLFYFDKDETSIFGEGIASLMKDVQELINASFRAMLDNAAISAGPQIEANVELLGPDEDPTEVYPFKVWLRTGSGVEAQTEAIRVHTLPSYTNEFMNMSSFIEKYADEVTTIPRFLQSGETQGGVSRTMGGLSMMYGNANISIKDQVKNFDDGITKPFISAMYDWNMQFNPKGSIKGDFEVQAKGTSSLVAKEVYMENLIQFANITGNPADQQYLNRKRLISEVAKALDVDDKNLLKSDEQVAQEQQAAMEQQRAQQQFDMQIIETARAGGISPDDLLNQLSMYREELIRTQQMMAQSGINNA